MAKTPALAKTSSPNTILAIALAAVAVLFFALFVFPQYRAIARADKAVVGLMEDVERQKLLHPLYAEVYKRAQFEPPKGLPFPEKKPLDRGDMSKLNGIFAEAAHKSGLELDTVLPQINSLANNSENLQVDVSVYGPFMKLEAFMKTIGEMPYVEHLELVKVQRSDPSDNISLRIWLALK